MTSEDFLLTFILGGFFGLFGAFMWRIRGPKEPGEKWYENTFMANAAPIYCILGTIAALVGAVGWILSR